MRRGMAAAAALGLAAALLAGCASDDAGAAATEAAPTVNSDHPALVERGLDGMDTRELIDHLDRLGGADRPSDLMASVRVDQLLISDGEEEFTMEIPDDLFYLAFAPYVSTSHECFYHSLTTCQGELTGEDVEVTILDSAGEVLVEETATTFENGFIGYWLPRDLEGTISVSHDGRTGEIDFATGEDSPTCVTTLQLAS